MTKMILRALLVVFLTPVLVITTPLVWIIVDELTPVEACKQWAAIWWAFITGRD